MADISVLSRLLNGLQRNVDLSQNSLVVGSLKVGSVTPTELTKAILDRLIPLQNGSDVDATYHTHDGRYNTKAQEAATTGSTLIGDSNTYSNFTPTAATVKGALAGIDAALLSAGGTTFSDSTFRIYDGVDPTKQLQFEIAGVTTATIRTITMANADVNLADVNEAILRGGTRAFTADQSMGGFKLTNVANGTASGDAVNYAQLAAVSSLISHFEWQVSVKDKDLTAPPGSPVTGDRYLIGLSTLVSVATGAWAGKDGQITEWNGTAWTFVVPTLGTYVGVDDENDGLYLFGGTLWDKKFFEATTASTGLVKVGFDIRLDASAAGAGLGFTSGILNVNVDGSTLEITTDTLNVKAGGITGTQLAASVAGAGLVGGAGSPLAVGGGDGITIAADAISVNASDLVGTGLEVDGSNNIRIAAQAGGLAGGSGTALSVAYSPRGQRTVAAGEAMAANTSFLVRWAVNGETAGRAYKADQDASTVDKFYAWGISLKTTAVSAGDPIDVTFDGTHTLGTSDTAFNATDIGKAVYLTAAGAFSVTPPTTANYAVWRVGMVQSTTSIWVGDKQLNGIN